MEGVLFFRSLPVVSPTLIDINIVITIDVTYYNLRSFHLLQNAAKQCIITFSYNTKQKKHASRIFDTTVRIVFNSNGVFKTSLKVYQIAQTTSY